ncbi:hypothetical protein ACH42_00420 [Endozoicomonas sp. (ex Bugula neritina AB1)]|nr:hypothetical protein ACH42_00420 [Endozoicomonas sp. (ex Bugula neritina AB1)]
MSGTTTFITPNVTFDDKLVINEDGFDLELINVPSETKDEVVVWFPKQKVLHAAEVLQGESFPNLHTTHRCGSPAWTSCVSSVLK